MQAATERVNAAHAAVVGPAKPEKKQKAAARARAKPYAKPPKTAPKAPKPAKPAAAIPPRVIKGLGVGGGREVQYFNSAASEKSGLKILSNFAKLETPLEFRGNLFWTSEHAYQSGKVNPADVWRLTVDGDLGDLRGFRHYMDAEKAENKMAWWGKGSVPMDGIVAKMVVNPEHNKKLKTPLRLRPLAANGDVEAQSVLWRAILMAKARADSRYRNALVQTGDRFLVEFDRGAQRAVGKGGNPFWTGLVDKESGDLYGINFMGVCQMRNRERLVE